MAWNDNLRFQLFDSLVALLPLLYVAIRKVGVRSAGQPSVLITYCVSFENAFFYFVPTIYIKVKRIFIDYRSLEVRLVKWFER